MPLLAGMEEHRPALPGGVERQGKRLLVLHHAEPAQRVGMGKRVGRDKRRRPPQHAGAGIVQQRLPRLGGQMVGQRQERILGRGLHIGDPVLGNANRQQVLGRQRLKQQPRAQRRWLSRHRRRDQFLDPLPDLDDLDGAGARMRLDAAPLRPEIGVVMVADIGQQEACLGLVNDDADVAAGAHRPEMRIARPINAMKL